MTRAAPPRGSRHPGERATRRAARCAGRASRRLHRRCRRRASQTRTPRRREAACGGEADARRPGNSRSACAPAARMPRRRRRASLPLLVRHAGTRIGQTRQDEQQIGETIDVGEQVGVHRLGAQGDDVSLGPAADRACQMKGGAGRHTRRQARSVGGRATRLRPRRSRPPDARCPPDRAPPWSRGRRSSTPGRPVGRPGRTGRAAGGRARRQAQRRRRRPWPAPASR